MSVYLIDHPVFRPCCPICGKRMKPYHTVFQGKDVFGYRCADCSRLAIPFIPRPASGAVGRKKEDRRTDSMSSDPPLAFLLALADHLAATIPPRAWIAMWRVHMDQMVLSGERQTALVAFIALDELERLLLACASPA